MPTAFTKNIDQEASWKFVGKEKTDGRQRLPLKNGGAGKSALMYGTAVVIEDGQVRFYTDLYGYDAELERLLAKGDRKLMTTKFGGSDSPKRSQLDGHRNE